MEELKVKDVMTHLVVRLRPEDRITDAAKRLLSNRISGAPVVEAGRLVGVVSEADLMKAFTPQSHRAIFAAIYPPSSSCEERPDTKPTFHWWAT